MELYLKKRKKKRNKNRVKKKKSYKWKISRDYVEETSEGVSYAGFFLARKITGYPVKGTPRPG